MPKKRLAVPVGARFGRLEVIAPGVLRMGSASYYCTCRCDCGRVLSVAEGSLRSGNTTSCGCKKGEKALQPGDRIGKLVVIKVNQEKSKRQKCIVYECACDCGNITFVTGGHLRSGLTKSCGCQRRENAKIDQKVTFSDPGTMSDERRTFFLDGNLQRNNTSGVTGVYFHSRDNVWVSAMTYKGAHYESRWKSKEDAVKERKRMEEEFWGTTAEG